MRDVVICEPIRTAVGGFGGGFKTVHAHEMASHVIRELMARTKLAPALGTNRRRRNRRKPPPSGAWWPWMLA